LRAFRRCWTSAGADARTSSSTTRASPTNMQHDARCARCRQGRHANLRALTGYIVGLSGRRGLIGRASALHAFRLAPRR
jgi:hypothetical protein